MRSGCYIALIFLLFSCYHEQEIPVAVDFHYEIANGSYTVPVALTITNNTTGADFYQWTFEGASPGYSDKKQPGVISYEQAGTYVIKLEAWNDTQRNVKEITLQLDSAVNLDFDVAVLVNDFVPAQVEIHNRTDGASSFEWTFDGGEPATSSEANPSPVLFNEPGEHTIKLKVSNGRESFSSTRTIVLKPALNTGFDIVPSFEDEDYEAPLTATLQNNTVSGLRYTWSSSGGSITDPAASSPQIHFGAPGDYVVTLIAENDKATQQVQHTISVKPNTNLYTMTDVKLGVAAAHETIGSFYAPRRRKVFTEAEVDASHGPLIDLVFFGINSSFGYCRFISPDSAAKFSFPAIPNATHTYFVNTQNEAVSLTPAQFDDMVNDSPLEPLNIAGNDTGISFFNNTPVPRIVLFETADGRKGAIKIKAYVPDGMQGYILADIKVQKSN